MVNIATTALVNAKFALQISMLPLFRDGSTWHHLSWLQGWTMIALPAHASIWRKLLKIIEFNPTIPIRIWNEIGAQFKSISGVKMGMKMMGHKSANFGLQ